MNMKIAVVYCHDLSLNSLTVLPKLLWGRVMIFGDSG